MVTPRRGVVRWRCLLCKPVRWRIGTWADWQYHYSVMHPGQDPHDER